MDEELEVINKSLQLVPQVMGSALLSQIQAQPVDGIVATWTAQYTHSHPATQTRKSAVATVTRRTYKAVST